MLADFSTGEGNEAPKFYSDVTDVKEIITLPLTHFHRDVDNAVISGGKARNVKTAIVSPPMIYGVGKGPLKKRSIQLPALIAGILSRGKGFTVGEGENVWDLVHVDDLGAAYILLVEEALKENGGRATWGPEGYYFVETGEFVSDPRLSPAKIRRLYITALEGDSRGRQRLRGLEGIDSIIWARQVDWGTIGFDPPMGPSYLG